jgi:TPR repeat protein
MCKLETHLPLLLIIVCSSVGLGATSSDRNKEWENRLTKARQTFDDAELDRLATEIAPVAEQRPDNLETQLLLAKVYLERCDLRRFKRKTFHLDRKEDKALRDQQETLSKQGMVYGSRATKLRPTSSEANRVVGELWIHQITGPISGLRFGPKGKSFIERAIELDKKNLEARRALGLMYLYNPPFNGGDKDKAAETFDQIASAGGDDRCYVLAARAYIKKDDPTTAAQRIKKGLEINPTNLEAIALLRQIQLDTR